MNFRTFGFFLVSFVLFFVFSSCSKKPAPHPNWNFKPKAIVLRYTAYPLLNIFHASPHTLMVMICEMSDANSFRKFAQYRAGIKKLLVQDVEDPSILSWKRVFIEPKSSGEIILDRVEKAKWIGIVAGYYSLDPKKSVKIIKIPYKIEEQGFIFKKKVAIIPTVKLHLIFTEDSIQLEKLY